MKNPPYIKDMKVFKILIFFYLDVVESLKVEIQLKYLNWTEMVGKS